MKKTILLFLPLLLFIAGVFVSCEEVQEVGKFDDWRGSNEAYMDSIKRETGENYIATIEQADAMELGKLYAFQIPATSTSTTPQYAYCRKLVKNLTGELPLFTGFHSNKNVYYCGSYITGTIFDKRFIGYIALDSNIPIPPVKLPTDFDSPTVLGSTVNGMSWPIQFMRTGERWMFYIPWQSGYGAENQVDYYGNVTIRGYSGLVFDLILNSVE